jgi:hypothetical protein
MKIILFFLCAGILIGLAGCSTGVPKPTISEKDKLMLQSAKADHAFIFSRLPNPRKPQSNSHSDKAMEWELWDRGNPGFDAKIGMNQLLAWKSGQAGISDFAILVPSTNSWLPMKGCEWTNCPCLGPWPAVFPTNGAVFLQFNPDKAKVNPGAFHYRIFIRPGADSLLKTKATSNGEDFPSETDDDIIDTTIIWDGGKGGKPSDW